MIAILPLLAAAALVGILHMSAPDHWVTLCILGRVAGWRRLKLLAVSTVAGLGHVILSIALGLLVVLVGYIFSSLISFYFTLAVGAIMLVVGLFVGIRALLSKEAAINEAELMEEDRRKLQSSDKKGMKKGAGYFAVLGAALSPDLSIVPIFLVTARLGFILTLYTALVFAIASIATIVLLVALGSIGLAKAFERIPPKYNDSLVGFVVAAVGVYIIVVG